MPELQPLKILIIEDEALLAMELESLIEDAGHVVVGWATSSAEACKLIDTLDADLAFVDVHLIDGPTGLKVASYIKQKKPTTVVFLTANPKRIPDDFAGACGVIAKPYTTAGLLGSLLFLQQGIRKPPPQADRPAGFTLSPHYLAQWLPSG